MKQKKLTKAQVAEVFEIFRSANPEPKTELEYGSPFELLVAVMLSAQATDKSVNLVTPGLFAVAPTPEAMLRLGEDGIREKIKSIGLFNSKAKNIEKTSRILCEKFGGEIPRERAELVKLPGVGIKTAGVVVNVLYGETALPVDTHVFRVSHRLGLVQNEKLENTEKALLKVIPKEYLTYAHHWLILHGRYICKARKPECAECPVGNVCKYPEKTV